MIQIGICDDDMKSASKIETLLQNIGKKQLIDMNIEVYADGATFLESLERKMRYDIIYLDIKMKLMDGVDTAKGIREIDQEAIIIYVSNYENYLMELFEVEPFRFIKKPIDEEKFYNYFRKAYEKVLKKDNFFEYKFNKMVFKVPLKDIMYFESSGRIIKIVRKDFNQIEKFYGRLNEIEKFLKNCKYFFLRIHQSYLVNFEYVQKMNYTKVCITNGKELFISESRQKRIREEYSEILGEKYIDR